MIDSSLPITKMVHNGVYITILPRDMLDQGLVVKLTPDATLLDRVLQYTTGLSSSAGIFDSLYVNREAQIASFSTSVTLKSVKLNGAIGDVRVNNVGFLVAGNDRAILVNLIYLSSDGIGVFQDLQKILDSLRFAG